MIPYTRPVCQYVDCTVQVLPGKTYCEAHEWIKTLEAKS
jgi:hypothetical protein